MVHPLPPWFVYFKNSSDILLLCSLIIENKETKLSFLRPHGGVQAKWEMQLVESMAGMVPGA